MLGHRLRRWPNIVPTIVQCLVFAGILPTCLYIYTLVLNRQSTAQRLHIMTVKAQQ